MPASVSAPIASGADAGRIPNARSPMCRSLPSIGGPALRHLRRQHHADGLGRRPHRQRRAEIADDRRDHVPVPTRRRRDRRRRAAAGSRRRRSPPGRAIGSPCPGTAASPNRTSPPVKKVFSRLSVARVRIMPRRISRRSSGVSDARMRGAPEEPVARVDDVSPRRREIVRARQRRASCRRIPVGASAVSRRSQRGRKRPAPGVESRLGQRAGRPRLAGGSRDRRPRERKPFRDELAEARQRRARAPVS